MDWAEGQMVFKGTNYTDPALRDPGLESCHFLLLDSGLVALCKLVDLLLLVTESSFLPSCIWSKFSLHLLPSSTKGTLVLGLHQALGQSPALWSALLS